MFNRLDDAGLPEAKKPAGYFLLMPPQEKADEFDFRSVVVLLLEGWRTIAAFCLLGALLAGVYAFFIAVPKFSSQAVLSVRVTGPAGGTGLSSQIGGLAAMAGVSVRADSSTRTDSIQVLQSNLVAEELVREKNLLPILFSKSYDAISKNWVVSKPPTIEEGVKAFKKTCSITEDLRTGLITVQIIWTDRNVAAEWVRDLINFTNRDLRASAISEANGNVGYLEEQLKRVQLESVRAAILNLLESNMNQAMLANSRMDYAFKVLDPPRVSDVSDRVSPNRRLIVAAGGMGGGALAVLIVIFVGPRLKKRNAAMPVA